MGFYASTFVFNSIPSEFFNIYLGTINDNGESVTTTSSDISPLVQKLFRRPSVLFWGAEQIPTLSFSLNMYSPDEITAESFSEISTWLFGQNNYQILRICQNDLVDVYFNCFLVEPQIIRVGNIIRGISCVVQCDSPWGWKPSKTYAYAYTGYTITDAINLLNESANSFYTYPTNLVITANGYNGSVSIVNTSDTSRTSTWTLTANEVVTMDCDKQIITSTIATYPLANFNKNWLRLIRGYNNLVISGNISALSITSPIAVKIGG
jgi:phage-related protein